jgi:hypothetical protein
MKIALAFFGITRSLSYTIKSIQKNILKQLSEHNVDIFMHTYSLKEYKNTRTKEHSSNYDNDEYKLLKPNYLKIEDQKIIKKKLKLAKYRTHKDPWNTNYNSVDNFILAQYSKYQLVSMIENAGHYDYIIFIRPDCLYLDKLTIDHIRKATSHTIVIPNFHLFGPYKFNDRFAITTSETYKIYGSLFMSLLKMSKEQPLHSETVMGQYLKDLITIRIPFRFSRIRVNGERIDFKNTRKGYL